MSPRMLGKAIRMASRSWFETSARSASLMTWDVFDFGKRRAAVRERQDQLAEAEENLRRLKEEVAVSIERSYNKVQRTKSLVEVATQVVKLRQESERLAQNQLAQGAVLISDRRQATAATYKAQAGIGSGCRASLIRRCSGRDGISRLGSGSSQSRTRAEARTGSAISANEAIAICAACSRPVRWP